MESGNQTGSSVTETTDQAFVSDTVTRPPESRLRRAQGRRQQSAHLQSPGGEVNASARYGLRLEADKHVCSKAVVHVIPKKTFREGWISGLQPFHFEQNNTGDSIDFIIFSVTTLNTRSFPLSYLVFTCVTSVSKRAPLPLSGNPNARKSTSPLLPGGT